ncbi:methyltransferase domain-containing protein [Bacillus lacus]|uniref:Methyltransferase domain-containing protein n=2 Tax=Metabacillus lacus TaxID=1983721 RepID=A0A7X2M042_9BACI|nr:methyltransferase domain-containing protein [Metabacillus lacus]
MKNMMDALSKNFRKPEGILGKIAGKVMSWENQEINEWTVEKLEIQSGDNVLEIGYGPGYGIEYILSNYEGTSVDGADVSETMKEQAGKRLQSFIEEGRARLWAVDIEKAELEKESYDRVLSVNNYTIWDSPREGLENVVAALRPGGRAAITMQPRQEDAATEKTKKYAKQIQDDFLACGMENIEVSYKDVRPELTVCVTAVKPVK